MIVPTLLAAALASPSVGPCDLATKEELHRVLGSPPVAMPVDETGEQTAPSCYWANINTWARVSIDVRTMEELSGLELRDGIDYYTKLKTGSQLRVDLPGVGDNAFVIYRHDNSGVVGVLKSARAYVFHFTYIPEGRARMFVIDVMGRQ